MKNTLPIVYQDGSKDSALEQVLVKSKNGFSFKFIDANLQSDYFTAVSNSFQKTPKAKIGYRTLDYWINRSPAQFTDLDFVYFNGCTSTITASVTPAPRGP